MLSNRTIELLNREKAFLFGLDLAFPEHFISASYLNDIFKEGLSIIQFERKYQLQSRSIEHIVYPAMNECYNLVLKKDLWGPNRVMTIGKESTDEDGPDCVIALAMRDQHEFSKLESFCRNNKKFRVMEDKPGHIQYEIVIDKWLAWDPRQALFFIAKPDEQTTKLSLTLKF